MPTYERCDIVMAVALATAVWFDSDAKWETVNVNSHFTGMVT